MATIRGKTNVMSRVRRRFRRGYHDTPTMNFGGRNLHAHCFRGRKFEAKRFGSKNKRGSSSGPSDNNWPLVRKNTLILDPTFFMMGIGRK